jgi:methylated-DNA-[protein]-cysteine S-methyltransferase
MYETFSVKCFSERSLFLKIFIEDRSVVRSEFSKTPDKEISHSKVAKKLKYDLKKYFNGEKIDFSDYSVKINGFTRHVLDKVREIPHGMVMTYGELAAMISTSPRAVGQALKRNPAPVIIPCHRVVASNGLGGYSYGIELKKMLLQLESK